jgi:hypothetical protein
MTVDGGMDLLGFTLSLHSSPCGEGLADLPMVAKGVGDPAGHPAVACSTQVDFGATAAMACLMTGLRVRSDDKRSFDGPAQGLMAEVVVVR